MTKERTITKDDIFKQLVLSTEDYRMRVSYRNELRKYSITIWAALLVFVGSKKLQLSGLGNFLLLSSPIIMFWILELLQSSITTRRLRFICQLEDRLSKDNALFNKTEDIYYNSADQEVDIVEKFSDLFTVVLTKEITNLFYIFQLIVSLVFIAVV